MPAPSSTRPTPPYALQEPETGLYLAESGEGKIILRARAADARRFHTSAQAVEYGSQVKTPSELVRVVA